VKTRTSLAWTWHDEYRMLRSFSSEALARYEATALRRTVDFDGRPICPVEWAGHVKAALQWLAQDHRLSRGSAKLVKRKRVSADA